MVIVMEEPTTIIINMSLCQANPTVTTPFWRAPGMEMRTVVTHTQYAVLYQCSMILTNYTSMLATLPTTHWYIDPEASQTIVHLGNGGTKHVPIVQVAIECSFYKGVVTAVVMENPLYDVLVEIIPRILCPGIVKSNWCHEMAHMSWESIDQGNVNTTIAHTTETR